MDAFLTLYAHAFSTVNLRHLVLHVREEVFSFVSYSRFKNLQFH